MVKKIKNADTQAHVWCGQTIQPNEYYEVQPLEDITWSNNSQLLIDIALGNAVVNNGTDDITDVNTAISYLKGDNPVEVIPTAPKNEYDLKPYGLGHLHIDASNQIYSITLSNKNGLEIDYSNCSITPEAYDCIFQNDSQIRDGVYSEDSGTITTFLGRLQEGSANLSRPVNLDYKIEIQEEVDVIYLWGIFFDAENYGEDDIVRLQVIDLDGVGVALGMYTQQEFEAMGSVVLWKEYDECWVRHLSKIVELNTPDGSPGQIPVGITLRVKYYCKDITKTDIKIWSDYKITIKD